MRYALSLRLLHAVMALLIIGLLALGLYMDSLPDGDAKWALYGLHKQAGLVALALIAVRLMVRLATRVPPLGLEFSKREQLFAKLGHYALYACMLIMPISGYCMSMLGGYGIKFLGMNVPNLVGEDKALGKLAYQFHETIGLILIALLVGHVGLAVLHQLQHRPIWARIRPW